MQCSESAALTKIEKLSLFSSDEEKHSGKVSKLVSEKSSMKSGFRPVSSPSGIPGPREDQSMEDEEVEDTVMVIE